MMKLWLPYRLSLGRLHKPHHSRLNSNRITALDLKIYVILFCVNSWPRRCILFLNRDWGSIYVIREIMLFWDNALEISIIFLINSLINPVWSSNNKIMKEVIVTNLRMKIRGWCLWCLWMMRTQERTNWPKHLLQTMHWSASM